MTISEIMELGTCPVMLSDGMVGLIIHWDTERNEVGVQVPGEADIRWIDVALIVDLGGGALAVSPF